MPKKINPPPIDPSPGRALAMKRWAKEKPNADYFRKISKLGNKKRWPKKKRRGGANT